MMRIGMLWLMEMRKPAQAHTLMIKKWHSIEHRFLQRISKILPPHQKNLVGSIGVSNLTISYTGWNNYITIWNKFRSKNG
jgi:hypothetical protein